MARSSARRPLGLEELARAIADQPEGVGPGALHRRFRDRITRRTLVRRLAELVARGRVATRGKARGLVYFVPAVADAVPAGTRLVASARGDEPAPASWLWPGLGAEPYVPVSPEGQAIRNHIRKPLTERIPVGYRRELLEDYVPNETFYLPRVMREDLARIGRSPDGDLPAGTYARQIYDRLLIDLSWASSYLEGNTYSLLDTQRLIEFGERAAGKNAQETQMILNHKAAIEFLIDQAEEIGFNRYTVLNLHAMLSDNLLPNPDAAGRLRERLVGIDGTTFHPLSVPQVIDECFQRILDKCAAIADPFEQAFFVMVHIPYLQPFEDVNKRVSRLAANIPLLKKNLCPLSFIDVPKRAYVDGTLGVYELTGVELLRDVFAWAYERSCQRYVALRQSLADPDPFRMHYRDALVEAVGEIVRRGVVEPEAFVREYAASRVPNHERDRFADTALADLRRLHEGTIARYRIRPPEFYAWKQAMSREREAR